jgi:hypothetical protein
MRLGYAALMALAAAPAMAATTYTSEAAFLAAAGGGLAFESFEAPVSVAPTSVELADVTFSCTGTTYCPGFFGVRALGNATDGRQTVFFATPDTATFTFDSAITHFGIDVIDLGTVGASDLTISWGSNSTVLYTGHSSGGVLFAGIIDGAGFTSVTFSATARDDGIDFDRLVYKGGTGVIPEPATWALMIAGFGLVGFAARRRTLAQA